MGAGACASASSEALGRGELSKYFSDPYLKGEVYKGSLYSHGAMDEVSTFDYSAPDGLVRVWRHAVLMCDLQDQEGPGQQDCITTLRNEHSEMWPTWSRPPPSSSRHWWTPGPTSERASTVLSMNLRYGAPGYMFF